MSSSRGSRPGFAVSVDFPQPPAEVFAWLADLRNRPRWQASLRAVEVAGDPPYGVGTRWADVTWPGLRPRLEVTVHEPGARWAEHGEWHGVAVDLDLEFRAAGPGTTVRATVSSRTPGWRRPLGWGLSLLGPATARDDLRRAARLIP